AIAPGSAGWDDPNGCWERRPDGRSYYRTSFGGTYYYYSEPPSYSRYSNQGGRWSGGKVSSGGAHGAPPRPRRGAGPPPPPPPRPLRSSPRPLVPAECPARRARRLP